MLNTWTFPEETSTVSAPILRKWTFLSHLDFAVLYGIVPSVFIRHPIISYENRDPFLNILAFFISPSFYFNMWDFEFTCTYVWADWAGMKRN